MYTTSDIFVALWTTLIESRVSFGGCRCAHPGYNLNGQCSKCGRGAK